MTDGSDAMRIEDTWQYSGHGFACKRLGWAARLIAERVTIVSCDLLKQVTILRQLTTMFLERWFATKCC